MARFLPACAVALILGIVGMHALAQHCSTPTQTAASGAHSTATPLIGASTDLAAHTAGHVHDAVAGAVQGATAAPAVDVDSGADGSSGGALMLCAAMLLAAGAGAALVLLPRLRGGLTMAVLLPRLHGVLPATLSMPLGTGPPAVWAFTVIRC